MLSVPLPLVAQCVFSPDYRAGCRGRGSNRFVAT